MAAALVEGWTERIVYQLMVDNVVQSLVDGAVEIRVRNLAGTPVQLSGTVEILDAPNGLVYFDPSPSDLLAASSPYLVRFKFTNAFGKVSYFPNSATPEYWNVAG